MLSMTISWFHSVEAHAKGNNVSVNRHELHNEPFYTITLTGNKENLSGSQKTPETCTIFLEPEHVRFIIDQLTELQDEQVLNDLLSE